MLLHEGHWIIGCSTLPGSTARETLLQIIGAGLEKSQFIFSILNPYDVMLF